MRLQISSIGKKYRGMHKTSDPNDGYLGSGNHIQAAIRKYGVKNFKKTVIFIAFDYDSMLWAESQLVDQDWVERQDTYNIVVGGGGSFTKRVEGSWVNLMQIESVKQKRKITMEDRYPQGQPSLFDSDNNPMKSFETRAKMVESRNSHPLGYHQGRTFFFSDQIYEKHRKRMTEANPMKTEECRQRIRDRTAQRLGFQNDQQLTSYIQSLYDTLAMKPSLICKVLGVDESTVICRLQKGGEK